MMTFNIATYCRYLPGPDDMLVLDIAYTIYVKFEEYPNALQIALYLDNMQVCTLSELNMHYLLKKKKNDFNAF